MSYKVLTLGSAYDDLAEIKEYLARFYPGTVKKFIALYIKRRNALRDFPLAHSIYEDNAKYRRMVVGDYLVFYVVKENAKIVEIHRVLHGSRDIRRHLS